MSSFQQFKVCLVVSGKDVYPDADGVLDMPHGTEYAVKVVNPYSNRAEIVLHIDGTKMGCWNLRPYETIVLERPAFESKRFTFLKADSKEAESVGVVHGDSSNGLVTVNARVEAWRDPRWFESRAHPQFTYGATAAPATRSMVRESASRERSSGATALGAKSDQRFGTTDKITNFDETKTRLVHFRLACVTPPPSFTRWSTIPPPIQDK